MPFILKHVALGWLLATTSLGAVAGVRSRQAEPSNFNLYAYGGDTNRGDIIGGFPIFYADGVFLQTLLCPDYSLNTPYL